MTKISYQNKKLIIFFVLLLLLLTAIAIFLDVMKRKKTIKNKTE